MGSTSPKRINHVREIARGCLAANIRGGRYEEAVNNRTLIVRNRPRLFLTDRDLQLPQSSHHAPPSAPIHSRRSRAHRSARKQSRRVFCAEQDYQFCLRYPKEVAEQFGCAVHAYVLMTNHVHLSLTLEREDSQVGWVRG